MDVVHTQRKMVRLGGGVMVSEAETNGGSSTAPPPERGRPGPLQRFRRRRRHSSDEMYHRRRKRRPILEDHYRVVTATDPRRPVVLPGAIRHEDDWARDCHDFFNLVVLVPVVVLNVMCWDWEVLLDSMDIAKAWTGEWFQPFFTLTAAYFMIDLIWIILVPTCVKSSGTIIQHHLATMVYILIPYYRPEYQWCMGACMIVEVNTWFLIARRVFNKQGFPPWIIDLSFVSIRVKLISILFYVTWIGIRCILYPYLMMSFYQAWTTHSRKVGTKWNFLVICIPLHAAFCLLNLKWSYDLLMSKVRYWRRRGHYKDSISKGL